MIVAAAILVLSSAVAWAAQTEGQIKSISVEKRTITLDDGNIYKMPGEFDVSSLEVGSDIVIAYDEVNGERLVTDMTVGE
jgi:Cu/Ag efflux protein CusF